MRRKPVCSKIYFDLFSFIFKGGGVSDRIKGKKQDKSKKIEMPQDEMGAVLTLE